MKINQVIIFIFTIAVSFMVGLYISDKKIDTLDRNNIALVDSLKQYKLDNGQLLYEKSTYELKLNQVEQILGIKNDEIKDIQKKLDESLSYISKLEGSVKIDTIKIDSIIYKKDSTSHDILFNYNEKWIGFNGEIKIDSSYIPKSINIYNMNIPMSLTVGLTNENKMFVTPDNPYIYITDIKGADIINNKKENKWSHGLSVGFGVQYGIINKKIDIGPQIGYYLKYNF